MLFRSRVNAVTPALFKKYRNAQSFAGADIRELQTLIKSTGFFRAKAKNIKGLATKIVKEHNGKVPDTLDQLVKLPGVGRKTANVVLNCAFGQPTIAVDTHIFRVANRTGLAPGANVDQVEAKLLKAVPAAYRLHAHHWLILHGRYTCVARKPLCPTCVVRDLCHFPDKTKEAPAAKPRLNLKKLSSAKR